MPTSGFLRTLIVAEIGLVIVSVVVSMVTESTLPEPLRAYLEAEVEADITTWDLVMLATGIPLLILLIVSSVGLFFFWRPARVLYSITMAAGLVMTPFFGPYVDSGWGTMFDQAAIVVSGAILALIYFSPLKVLYERPKIVD